MKIAINQINKEIKKLYVQYDKIMNAYYKTQTSTNPWGDSDLYRQADNILSKKITPLIKALEILENY
jgi:hypothetical protein